MGLCTWIVLFTLWLEQKGFFKLLILDKQKERKTQREKREGISISAVLLKMCVTFL